MTIQVHVPEEMEAVFEGRDLMIVPMTEDERNELGTSLGAVLKYLTLLRQNLSTLGEILESAGDKEGRIAKTILQLRDPSTKAHYLQDRVLTIIGRAVFVSHQPKGPVQ